MENLQPGNEPSNVGILIFDDVEVLDFCGPFEVFSVTRREGVSTANEADRPFAVFTIAQKSGIVKARGGLLVQPHFGLENHPPIDILVVPGGQGTRKEIDNPVIIEWIERVTNESKIKTSVCTGAFLLAKAGRLENLRATTHWASLDRFQQDFPRVTVIRNTRWVDEGDYITSAGVEAGIDMSLHVVERLLGRRIAEQTARMMEYEWNENKPPSAVAVQ